MMCRPDSPHHPALLLSCRLMSMATKESAKHTRHERPETRKAKFLLFCIKIGGRVWLQRQIPLQDYPLSTSHHSTSTRSSHLHSVSTCVPPTGGPPLSIKKKKKKHRAVQPRDVVKTLISFYLLAFYGFFLFGLRRPTTFNTNPSISFLEITTRSLERGYIHKSSMVVRHSLSTFQLRWNTQTHTPWKVLTVGWNMVRITGCCCLIVALRPFVRHRWIYWQIGSGKTSLRDAVVFPRTTKRPTGWQP